MIAGDVEAPFVILSVTYFVRAEIGDLHGGCVIIIIRFKDESKFTPKYLWDDVVLMSVPFIDKASCLPFNAFSLLAIP